MPDASSAGVSPGVPLGIARLLLFSTDPEALERVRPVAGGTEIRQAADAESARRLYYQDLPDVVVLDAGGAGELLAEILRQEYPPPVIVLGSAESRRLLDMGAFACLSSAADLPAWLVAASRYRRLQRENQLIRRETDRIHTELLTSYGAVAEQSDRLKNEVQRSARELEESEQKYRALINDASEAIFLVEVDSRRILEVNQKAEELGGVSKERLIRLRLTDLLGSEEQPSLEQALDRATETGSLVYNNATLRRADGRSLSVDLSASRIRYAGHEVMQCICHDVTDRKRLEAQLRHQTEELERQVEERTRALQVSHTQLIQQEKMAALGALVAGIAHDMHTPIGTITSNSDILARSLARLRDLIAGECCPESFRTNPDLTRVVGIVDEISRVNQLASERIIGIVRSLRNFARLDEADVQSTDLHEGLDSTLTLVHHELKNRITVRREYGEIPPIQCHPNQLNQVFMNMLVNAAHAIAGTGTITIRTFREGDAVKVQISDTGSGIKPESLSRIFEAGFTTKGAGVGTGLGLAICHKIIQDHKGEIEVESEVGRGTTFIIRLPIEWKTS